MGILVFCFQKGNTAMLYSAFGNHVECVKALLEWGADITCQNSQGHSALDIAVTLGHKEGNITHTHTHTHTHTLTHTPTHVHLYLLEIITFPEHVYCYITTRIKSSLSNMSNHPHQLI